MTLNMRSSSRLKADGRKAFDAGKLDDAEQLLNKALELRSDTELRDLQVRIRKVRTQKAVASHLENATKARQNKDFRRAVDEIDSIREVVPHATLPADAQQLADQVAADLFAEAERSSTKRQYAAAKKMADLARRAWPRTTRN